jgi:adenosylmethionine-8-amino-7-oxononanoate aminotransferase
VVIRDRMMNLGVITRAIGADANTFCPSFVISDAQVDQIIDVLATALKAN